MFLKGLIIGLIFGIPVGAVGVLTLQRTLRYGFVSGLLSGFGCSVADTLYACIGAFGITFVSDFILNNQFIINVIGAIILLYIGIRLLIKKNISINLALQKSNVLKMFFLSFVVGITNPATILTFVFAFSWFGISSGINSKNRCCLVFGVFAGTALWWFVIALMAVILKNKINENVMLNIDKGFGVIIILFCFVIFFKTFWG